MARILAQAAREFVAVILDLVSAYTEELATQLHVWSLSIQHPGYHKRYTEALQEDPGRKIWE